MRLYSKFHDYYDTAIGYGIDPNIVYSRKTIEYDHYSNIGKQIEDTLNTEKIFRQLYLSCKNIDITNMIIVLFCGKLFTGLELTKNTEPFSYRDDVEYCYDIETVEKFFKKHSVDINETKEKRQSYFRKRYKSNKRTIIDFFDENKQIDDNKYFDLHFLVDSPIILLKRDEEGEKPPIIINPKLNDFQFYRCVDSFSTFQEISMFISGVMGGKIPSMIEIKDEDKIVKHGFDKFSFRRLKETVK